MSTKHTPGPWQWTAVEGGWDGVRQANGPLICKLVLNEPENARLIAAAPELLAMLKRIEDAEFGWLGDWPNRDEILALIGKAGGEA